VTRVLAHSEQGYTANMPLDVLKDDDPWKEERYSE
jgi:hypothetical protein